MALALNRRPTRRRCSLRLVFAADSVSLARSAPPSAGPRNFRPDPNRMNGGSAAAARRDPRRVRHRRDARQRQVLKVAATGRRARPAGREGAAGHFERPLHSICRSLHLSRPLAALAHFYFHFCRLRNSIIRSITDAPRYGRHGERHPSSSARFGCRLIICISSCPPGRPIRRLMNLPFRFVLFFPRAGGGAHVSGQVGQRRSGRDQP